MNHKSTGHEQPRRPGGQSVKGRIADFVEKMGDGLPVSTLPNSPAEAGLLDQDPSENGENAKHAKNEK